MADSDPPSKKDFFISYNKADRAWAEWIAWHLEESGHYSVVIQAWDFGPASNFVIEMDRAIQECERVLAVLSPDYLTSLFTKPEWAAYFAQDPTSEERRIVSLRVRECELKGLLASIVYGDIVGKTDDDAKAALLDAVKVGRRKPANAPSFPGRSARVVLSKPRFPGALPDIWNVPHLRNPNFTEPGRRLIEIRDALCSGKPAALTQALAGLGGVGKTQLATEYTYRHAGDYDLVWWVRSEQSATLAADYAALATKLDLPEKDASEQPLIIAAVRDALQHQRNWLLIFDNVNTPEEIRDYLPAIGGHVLITSRHPTWGALAQTVPVKKWMPEIAVEFLLKRTGQVNSAAAMKLAEELDYLPLALEQAAAYIDSAQMALASYLGRFRERHLDLLQRGQPGTDYPATVATTWELSFRQLEAESPGGALLLQLCAFLAPDNIPRDGVVAGAKYFPELLRETVSDALTFEDAVRHIRGYSLIEVGENSTLSVHRLVQAVVRDRLHSVDRQNWARIAVEVVHDVFPITGDDFRTWKECDRLLAHAMAATEISEYLGAAPVVTGRLLNRMGLYVSGRAEYGKAKTLYERALKLLESDDPSTASYASCVNNLGSLLRAMGDFSGAKAALEQGIQMVERSFGPQDPRVAICLSNLGAVLQDLHDFSGARAAFEHALEIDKNALGYDHPNVAIRLNNLGNVLQAIGELPKASAVLERALEILEKTFGGDHPNVGACVANLGGIQMALGDFSGAKAAAERALVISERTLGPNHPHVASHARNVGVALWALGDLPGARTAFERALRIVKVSLGEDHPQTRLIRENLAAFPS